MLFRSGLPRAVAGATLATAGLLSTPAWAHPVLDPAGSGAWEVRDGREPSSHSIVRTGIEVPDQGTGVEGDAPAPVRPAAGGTATPEPPAEPEQGIPPEAPAASGLPQPEATAAGARSPEEPDGGLVVIELGDSLWSVAAAHVVAARGPSASRAEIGAYWARVVARNRAHLRSGDPGLIFPGEEVRLPTLDEPISGPLGAASPSSP